LITVEEYESASLTSINDSNNEVTVENESDNLDTVNNDEESEDNWYEE
jgi:hypothetical protein